MERRRECTNSVSQNVRERERERENAVSGSQNGENEFLEDNSLYRQSLCGQLQMCGTKSKLQM